MRGGVQSRSRRQTLDQGSFEGQCSSFQVGRLQVLVSSSIGSEKDIVYPISILSSDALVEFVLLC